MSLVTRKKNTRRPDKVTKTKYRLNTVSAMAKKLAACDRNMTLEEKKGNFYVQLSTAGFEAFRTVIMDEFRLPRDGKKSRQIEHNPAVDDAGLVVHDVFRVKNWSVMGPKISQGRVGSCAATINLYRTTSSAMINGADGEVVTDALAEVLCAIAKSKEVENTNKIIKKTLMTHPMPATSQLPSLPPTNHDHDTTVSAVQGLAQTETIDAHDESCEEMCHVCDEPATHDVVMCDVCEHWLHFKCESLKGRKLAEVKKPNSRYTCHSCFQLLPNSEPAAPTVTTQAVLPSAAPGATSTHTAANTLLTYTMAVTQSHTATSSIAMPRSTAANSLPNPLPQQLISRPQHHPGLQTATQQPLHNHTCRSAPNTAGSPATTGNTHSGIQLSEHTHPISTCHSIPCANS